MSAEGKKFCPQAATDVELLDVIAQNGCDHAVEELINRHAGLVRSVIGGVLKGQCPIEDRKDVEQEVWLRIWRYRRPFDISRGGMVAALIRRIAWNTALSYVLRYRKRRSEEEPVDDNQLDVLKAQESATQWFRDSYEEQSFVVSDLVDRALSELSDKHSRLVRAIMDEQIDATYKEFAERFQTTESNVKVVMHRFKKRYIKLLAEYREGNGG
jgi:RNA polymerase sigma factor (sigma-70 family)